MRLYCCGVKGAWGAVVGCQEWGNPPSPARHVAGVVALVRHPESLHREAVQSSEQQVKMVGVVARVVKVQVGIAMGEAVALCSSGFLHLQAV